MRAGARTKAGGFVQSSHEEASVGTRAIVSRIILYIRMTSINTDDPPKYILGTWHL